MVEALLLIWWRLKVFRLVSLLSLTLALCCLQACSEEQLPAINATSILEDTDDGRGPYEVSASLSNATERDTLTLHFSLDEERWYSQDMSLAADGSFHALIDPMDSTSPLFNEVPWMVGTRVHYYIELSGRVAALDPPDAPVASYSFDIVAPRDELVILEFSPRRGKPAGGDMLYISGAGFDASTQVFMDGAPVSDLDLSSSFFIRARTPAHAPGLVDITLRNANGSVSLLSYFIYEGPGVCLEDADCLEDEVCRVGTCRLPGCAYGDPCSLDEICDAINNTCVSADLCQRLTCPAPLQCSSSLEACVQCTTIQDCASGERCMEGRCRAECSDDEPCADTADCNAGLCYPIDPCAAANCPEDTRCDERGLCVITGCGGCPEGYACDESSQLCVAANPCGVSSCEPGYYCSSSLGYCVPESFCEALSCPSDTRCDESSLSCTPNDPCVSLQCPSGLQCEALTGLCIAATSCVIDEDCDDGFICNGPESCVNGSCQDGLALNCSAPGECMLATCSELAGGCVSQAFPENWACSLGLCKAGVCEP